MPFNPLEEFAELRQDCMRRLYESIIKDRHWNALYDAYLLVQSLWPSKNDMNLAFIRARVPLPLIVALGDLDLAKNVISNGVNVNTPTLTGNFRALNMACTLGDVKMAELLLQNNAEVNAPDGDNVTPLVAFFENVDRSSDIDNCYRMTRLLVSYGAKLAPHHTETMMKALCFTNRDTLMLLVNEANGNLNFRFEGDSCLHLAVDNSEPGVLEFVIEVFRRENMDINSRNDCGDTPLLRACYPGLVPHYKKAVKTLLKSGADVNVKNMDGHTSFDLLILRSRRDEELAWLFFDHGLDILGSEVESLSKAVSLKTSWTKDIIAEIAKKSLMGEIIVGKNLKTLAKFYETVSYLRLCSQQLGEMRKKKFYKNVTFWDVLTADQTKLMRYAGNTVLVKAFFDNNCNRSFSIYCMRMRMKFINVMSRNSLIDLSTGVVCKTIKRPELYEIFQHEVMTYMKKDDIFKLLGCCKKASYKSCTRFNVTSIENRFIHFMFARTLDTF